MSAKNRYGALKSVLSRNETYVSGFNRLGVANIIMAAVTGISISAAWWSFSQVPEPRYFVATEDGRIIPLVPTDQPYYNNGQVTNFAVEAITRALTFSFVTWRQDLSEASEYFERPTGWNNFLDALNSTGTLDMVRNRRMVASVVANGATIVRSELRGSRYTWVIQIPITITYQSSGENVTENRLAEVEVARLRTYETPRGMGVTRVLIR